MSDLFNRIFGRLETLFSKPRLRIIKTLYVNFRLLPFSQAVKLPVYVYGPLKIISLKGKMKIEADTIRKGMVCFGYKSFGPGFSGVKNRLLIAGTMVVRGDLIIYNGFSLFINRGAVFAVGNGITVGHNAIMMCYHSISMGDFSRFSTGLYMIDTNGHHIMDIEKRTIDSIVRRIDIGGYSWIGNNVSVARGTVLPGHTIVANKSLVNRDYTKDVPEYSIIAGTPAKLIKTGFARVYNEKNESMLRKFFVDTGHDTVFRYEGDDIKGFCYGHEI